MFHSPTKTQGQGVNKNGDYDKYDDSTIVYPSALVAAIIRKRNQIIELLLDKSDESREFVKNYFKEYMCKIEIFHDACQEQQHKSNVSSEDAKAFCEWRAQCMEKEDRFQDRIKHWLNPDRGKITGDEVRPHDSVSQTSRHSSLRSVTSSVRAKLLQQKAKTAAKKKFLNETLKLEEEKRLIEKRQQDIAILQEEEEQDNLEKQLNELEDLESSVSSKISKNSEAHPQKLKISSLENKTDFKDILSQQNDITQMLTLNQSRAMLLNTEIETFDGSDVTAYSFFILSFERIIENRCIDYIDKYYNLLKYTKGHAHTLVKSCGGTDPENSFKNAKKELKQKYGNEYNISNSYLEKLEKWPEIKNEDSIALEELAIFLATCANMMKDMSGLNQLNSLKEIRDIVKKLPYDLRKQFRRKVGREVISGKAINFQMLVDFVNEQSQLLKLPLLGDIKDDSKRRQNRDFGGKEKRKTFYTSTVSEKNENEKNEKVTKCPCCAKNNHELNECIFFNKKSMSEKEDFIKKNKLCFACLKTGHSSRGCNNRMKCKKCSKLHPTSLHRNNFQNKQEKEKCEEKKEDHRAQKEEQTVKKDVLAACAQVKNTLKEVPKNETKNAANASNYSTFLLKNDRVVYAAVPVYIRVKGSDKKVCTYMGMDNFASDVFMDAGLLDSLGTKGVPTKLSLTTMEKTQSKITTKLIENLEIISIDGNEYSLIKKIYAKENWPFDIDDSPRQSDIQGYAQFDDLPFNFVKKKIGLLVGVNMTEIVRPLAIINTTKNGPYASQHKFGWALNGPVKGTLQNKNSSSFKIQINEENELTLENKLNELYNREFIDTYDKTLAPSFEDLKWEEKVEKSLEKKETGHFEIALPFKFDDVMMPNNFSQAYYRLKKLKEHFIRNQDYFKEYQDFMDKMINNSFVELVPKEELECREGKVWFLTHFGVRHKQKNKLRIVFDCSLKFKNVSLNDQLLQGPDLTNSLVGVLLRFRQERIAVSGDIESMFYQIKTPTDSSNFLRFLWFANNNLNEEPVQYRLVVHVFGAKSSPSCSNYALKQTALQAGCEISELAKKSILHSFYVDDLLLSLKNETSAINILKEIQYLLQENGFNLTGIVSNSRKVLNTVAPEKLSKEIKKIEFSKEELPYERALGVVWNVE